MPDSRPENERGCTKAKCRFYASVTLCVIPPMMFCFDLSNKDWVESSVGDSYNKHSAGTDFHWKGPTYFVVTAILGALGGAIACSYEDHKEREPLAGAIGGFVGCPIALGIAVGFLDIVSNTYDFVLYLICILGLIPGFIIYLFVKEILCEEGTSFSSAGTGWRNDGVQMV